MDLFTEALQRVLGPAVRRMGEKGLGFKLIESGLWCSVLSYAQTVLADLKREAQQVRSQGVEEAALDVCGRSGEESNWQQYPK